MLATFQQFQVIFLWPSIPLLKCLQRIIIACAPYLSVYLLVIVTFIGYDVLDMRLSMITYALNITRVLYLIE